jgi:hypothetical protein
MADCSLGDKSDRDDFLVMLIGFPVGVHGGVLLLGQ